MKRSKWFGMVLDSKAWITRHVNDPFVRKAQQEGMRSRSAYKLQEIQQKYHFIQPSSKVLDIGAAPGGWSLIVSQILSKGVGSKPIRNGHDREMGRLVCVDLLPMDPIDHATIIQGDFLHPSTQQSIREAIESTKQFDVILSDMLHNATGQRELDHFKSMDLCHSVFSFSQHFLSSGGSLLCKYYQGQDEQEWINMLREEFEKVKTVKPKSSRSESKEIYVLAMKKKKRK